MSYQVLARKWRPQHFGQLVGQEHVKAALSNALNNSRLHHAYLFTGTRGVGKTTIARIFAKSLNCETGITAEPCGQCRACQEIDTGNFVDLLEIDAASRTKVEDTRDLLDNVQYAPSRGRFKVYLIDEVHMLSKHSFNALLKTLEEPPPHVKFLLATTDPQKLPVTVLSRCLQFSLKALSQQQISQHLAFILNEEHIPFEDAALNMLAKAARGSLRDSLSLTDQAIAQSNAHLTLPQVRDMLGYLDQTWAQQLLIAIINRDIDAMQQQLASLIGQHSDISSVMDDMLSLLHQAAITQLQPSAAELSEQPEFVRQLADSLTAASIQLYYQLLISGKKELPYAPDPLTGVEMSLLRALAFIPSATDAVSHTSVSVKPVHIPVLPVVKDKTAEAELIHSPEIEQVETSNQVKTSNINALSSDTTEGLPASAPVTVVESAETAEKLTIDPVTARIMQRRGVVADKLSAPEQSGLNAPKKPERPQAPSIPAKPFNTRDSRENTANPEQASQVVQQVITAEASYNSAVMTEADTTPSVVHDDSLPESLPESRDNYSAEDDFAQWESQQYDAGYDWAVSHTLEPEARFDGQITEENFSVRFAAQVDAWAARLENLDCGGLMRLFLLNSAASLQGQQLKLTITQSQQHLDNPVFRDKLQQVLNQSFGLSLELELVYQAEVPDCPLMIQQRIELERRNYLIQLLQQDPKVQQMQQMFAAELLTETVTVN